MSSRSTSRNSSEFELISDPGIEPVDDGHEAVEQHEDEPKIELIEKTEEPTETKTEDEPKEESAEDKPEEEPKEKPKEEQNEKPEEPKEQPSEKRIGESHGEDDPFNGEPCSSGSRVWMPTSQYKLVQKMTAEFKEENARLTKIILEAGLDIGKYKKVKAEEKEEPVASENKKPEQARSRTSSFSSWSEMLETLEPTGKVSTCSRSSTCSSEKKVEAELKKILVENNAVFLKNGDEDSCDSSDSEETTDSETSTDSWGEDTTSIYGTRNAASFAETARITAERKKEAAELKKMQEENAAVYSCGRGFGFGSPSRSNNFQSNRDQFGFARHQFNFYQRDTSSSQNASNGSSSYNDTQSRNNKGYQAPQRQNGGRSRSASSERPCRGRPHLMGVTRDSDRENSLYRDYRNRSQERERDRYRDSRSPSFETAVQQGYKRQRQRPSDENKHRFGFNNDGNPKLMGDQSQVYGNSSYNSYADRSRSMERNRNNRSPSFETAVQLGYQRQLTANQSDRYGSNNDGRPVMGYQRQLHRQSQQQYNHQFNNYSHGNHSPPCQEYNHQFNNYTQRTPSPPRQQYNHVFNNYSQRSRSPPREEYNYRFDSYNQIHSPSPRYGQSSSYSTPSNNAGNQGNSRGNSPINRRPISPRPRPQRWIAPQGYRSPKANEACVYCMEWHLPDQCYKQPDPKKRKEILMELDLCVKCTYEHQGKCFIKVKPCIYCKDNKDYEIHHWSTCPLPTNVFASNF